MPENRSRDHDARPSEVEPEDNVIRFPRDWFGPLEELVPLGQTAPTAEAADLEPPTADDFWGEGSAAIQQFVQAPADDECLQAPGTEHGLARRLRPSVARAKTGPIAVAAVACCAIAIALFTGASPRPAAMHSARRTGLATAASTAAGRATLLADAAVRRVVVRQMASHHHTRGAQRRAPAIRHTSRTAPSVAYVHETTQSATGSAPAGQSATPAAGPVGPGAPFAPGQMG